MNFFDQVELRDPDPIFNLNHSFKVDGRANKVNLGVGAYKTADLQPMVLNSVKKAEELLANANLNKEYLPIDGEKTYLKLLQNLVFGEKSERLLSGSIYGAQAIGGTGALSLGASFLHQEFSQNIAFSDPTWANHQPIFIHAGFDVGTYAYYDSQNHGVAFDKMCNSINALPKRSVILLHACCHNPTGFDLSFEQWKDLSEIIKKRRLLPFFDCAYQGFGDGIDDDAQAMRYFLEEGHEMLVAFSCSKNFGLYGERVGALFIALKDKETVERVASQIKILIRRTYSNPPSHGAQIVKTILETEALKKEWLLDLKNMRERVAEMRRALASGLVAKNSNRDFSFMKKQKGMFSFSGLSKDQVGSLVADYGIYMPSSGRINVAGLSSQNLEYVLDAILCVTE